MSDTYVVELNQNMASWSRPGEYEVQLATPIEINEGDQLSFRMASLDSNITDQDTILITNDKVLTGVFSYYEVNYNGDDKQSVGVGGGSTVAADYAYYAAYNDVELVRVTGIQMEIVGFRQGDPLNSDGGAYIVGTNGVGSTVDPNVNFSAVFSYIDVNGIVQQPAFTGSNVSTTTVPNAPGVTAYYTADTTGLLTLQVTPFVMRKNSLKFSGVNGLWPGARSDAVAKRTTFFFGAFVPRANTVAEYDDKYPYATTDFTLGTVTTVPVGNSTGNVLDKQVFSLTLKAGRYDPQSLAVQLTQLFSSAGGIKPAPISGDQIYVPNNPLLTRTDEPINANMVFNRVPATRVQTPIVFQDGETYKYFNPAAPTAIPPYFVGTTQFSIEYDVGGGQVFQLSYNHMPLSDPARPGEQDIGLFTNGSPGLGLTYNAVTSASGIVFHDLQPASFWQDQLGLRDKLIVPLLKDTNGLEYYTLTSMVNCITFGFQGLGSFLLPPTPTSGTNYPDFRKMSPLQPTTDPLYLNCTGLSRAIIGDTITVNRIGGYFLIEVLNVFRNGGGYIDNQQNRRQVSAVVSTQMDNNNCITGYSDSDSIGYVHRGSSYMISSAVVRILNPLTKVPVQTLGPNNTVWLQVQKQIQQMLSVAPVKKKPIIKRREQVSDKVDYAKVVRDREAAKGADRTPKEDVKEPAEDVKTKPKPQITLKAKPKKEAAAAEAAKPKPQIGAIREKLGFPPVGKQQPEPGAVAKKREMAFAGRLPPDESVSALREKVPPELK